VKSSGRLRFTVNCMLLFFLAAAITCGIRAKYRAIPWFQMNTDFSAMLLEADSSFLQYNQAGGEAGTEALLGYLGTLQKIQRSDKRFPQNKLHFEIGLTYLRLYRSAEAAGRPDQANSYLESAQWEFTKLGWQKESLSTQSLIKSLQTREAAEAKFYNADEEALKEIKGQKP
jgi:hypothetical protein